MLQDSGHHVKVRGHIAVACMPNVERQRENKAAAGDEICTHVPWFSMKQALTLQLDMSPFVQCC